MIFDRPDGKPTKTEILWHLAQHLHHVADAAEARDPERTNQELGHVRRLLDLADQLGHTTAGAGRDSIREWVERQIRESAPGG